MPDSEERLQLLLPKKLKNAAEMQAKRLGLSVGEYVRGLIESDLRNSNRRGGVTFPFGEAPIRTGRTKGSIEHGQRR